MIIIRYVFFVFQGAFACDMILLYMMNTSSFYRERKFEIINFKYVCLYLHNCFLFFFKLDQYICCCITFRLYGTGGTGPNTRTERQDTGKRDPGNQLQRKLPTTPSKSLRKLNLLRSPLLQRASLTWRDGVPPFHVTRDKDTRPFSLLKVQSQGIISLSLHTVKFADKKQDKSPAVVSVMLQVVEAKVGLMSTSHPLAQLLVFH